ncbi:hypothetical protein BSPWISOXPB_7677 [uncultured Gammaproteobacteria bacterium]|nr:hypothetical protein BSPWISOXPB_7677 [uncultured Gammaproteobacteria bacterium]
MKEFSLENIAENIHFGKTKMYFTEVLSSYHNCNYRSSVVMLWSVSVCDIIYKLQYLVDLYADSAAKEILDEITSLQDSDKKSPAWEIKLLEDIFNKTNLINSPEYENLRYLQQQRHLSAHPVLNHNSELHSPNKETVRALLRNTLEGLLVKPPFYTKKILHELLDDISENSAALNTRRKVKQYVESRYLNRLTPQVELSIFRSLWKLVFKLSTFECEKNRLINLQTLEVINKRNIALVPETIAGEKDYFSNIASGGTPLSFLVYYLSQNSEFYNLLSEDCHLKIKHYISTESIGKTLGWFVKVDLNTHYNDLLEWIKSEKDLTFEEGQWDSLLAISDTVEWQKCFCKLIGAYYGVSYSFNQADTRFKNVQQYLHLFNLEALKFILSEIENNDQTYIRGKSPFDHTKIKQRILEVSAETFDFEPYPWFSHTVCLGEGL